MTVTTERPSAAPSTQSPRAPQRGHRGLFTIPVTPFTAEGALDVDSLRRVIAFCVEGGAHGIVAPVNASEFTTLTPEERQTVTRTVVQLSPYFSIKTPTTRP